MISVLCCVRVNTGAVFEYITFGKLFYMNWRAMDIDALKKLYEEESGRLQQKLLRGTAWKKVAGRYKKLTEMSSAIYNKLNSSSSLNPVEHRSG